MAKSIREMMERIRAGDILATIHLMDIEDPDIDELCHYLGDHDETVNGYAVLMLCKARPPDLLNRLTKMLSSPNEILRSKAIDALGKLKESSAIPFIESMLNDESNRVRMAAEIALRKLKTGTTGT